MIGIRHCVGLAIIILAVPPVAAQTEVAGITKPAERGGADCDTQAALYSAETGFKLWVTRRGTMIEDNPLRPLSQDTKLVLEVAVNGRIATAHGTDFAHLHRSGSPQQLEEMSAGPIRWEPKRDGMPATIRVVSEDGRVVLGPLRFVECGEAPKTAAAPAKRPIKKAAPRAAREPSAEVPPGFALPQGAIP
jgi:hypothetical protein